MMRRVWTALAVVGALSAIAAAAAPKQSYTLRYRFSPGVLGRYKTDVTARIVAPGQQPGAGGPAFDGTGTTVVHILKVNSDGSAQAQANIEDYTFRGMGENRTGTSQAVTFTVTPTGQVRGIKTPNSPPVTGMLGPLARPDIIGTTIVQLPPRSVKVGDVWTMKRPSPLNAAKPVTQRSRFVSVERVKGIETARLNQAFSFPINMVLNANGSKMRLAGNIKVNGFTNFAIREGKAVRVRYSGTGPLTMTNAAGSAKDAGGLKVSINIQFAMDLL